MDSNKQSQVNRSAVDIGIQRSYNEVVEYLNAHWSAIRTNKHLQETKKLDTVLGAPSKDINAILVAGTNGKSLTINLATQLFKEEGLTVGTLYAPHILTYNERFSINNETISNKNFTELANNVINIAEMNNIKADTLDILTMMSLLHFKNNNIDVAFFEVSTNNKFDAVNICTAQVLGVTRITNDQVDEKDPSLAEWISTISDIVQTGTHVVSADQSKLSLQEMMEKVKANNGLWDMPIRKLAPLSYPFEQMHGRCAALAERMCQIFVDTFADKSKIDASSSLLAKEKGRRGRPTLEAKRQAELNPKKTIEQYWKETANTLPGRFQLLDKEKPSILLDNAHNIDALKNLFLGIRLLHYQRPLKGITFIFGCNKKTMKTDEFLRNLRYFAKKNSAQVIFCPINNNVPGLAEESWDIEQITNDVKALKIKARAAKNFKEAFEAAKKSVDERNGLVVITGSQSILVDYWQYKDIKKL